MSHGQRRTTLDDVPDRLLRLVLENLVSPLWLVHAAATCKRWRRLAASPSFLEDVSRDDSGRFVVGSYHNRSYSNRRGASWGAIFAPSPAIDVDSRHFSLDFLPGGGRSWEVVDSRRDVILLAKKRAGGWMRRCFPDLIELTDRLKQAEDRVAALKRQAATRGVERTLEIFQSYFGAKDDSEDAMAIFAGGQVNAGTEEELAAYMGRAVEAAPSVVSSLHL